MDTKKICIDFIGRLNYFYNSDLIDTNIFYNQYDYIEIFKELDNNTVETVFKEMIKKFDNKYFYIKMESYPPFVRDYYEIVIKNIDKINIMSLMIL